MRISSGGMVGIGMSPSNKVDVSLLADERVRLYSTLDNSWGCNFKEIKHQVL